VPGPGRPRHRLERRNRSRRATPPGLP
jgi:hypothetical protein